MIVCFVICFFCLIFLCDVRIFSFFVNLFLIFFSDFQFVMFLGLRFFVMFLCVCLQFLFLVDSFFGDLSV